MVGVLEPKFRVGEVMGKRVAADGESSGKKSASKSLIAEEGAQA